MDAGWRLPRTASIHLFQNQQLRAHGCAGAGLGAQGDVDDDRNVASTRKPENKSGKRVETVERRGRSDSDLQQGERASRPVFRMERCRSRWLHLELCRPLLATKGSVTYPSVAMEMPCTSLILLFSSLPEKCSGAERHHDPPLYRQATKPRALCPALSYIKASLFDFCAAEVSSVASDAVAFKLYCFESPSATCLTPSRSGGVSSGCLTLHPDHRLAKRISN